MLKIRVYYDDQRELGELIRLLSPRLNYCRDFPDEEQKKCYLGLKTGDLIDDLVTENQDEASGTLEILGYTPMTDIVKGGNDDD